MRPTKKIGIMGAMIEEVEHLKKLMTIDKETQIGNRSYYSGKIHDTEVTLVFSRWGKVASSSTTTTLINLFNVDFVIFTGVAGAVAKELNIGDVVIGSGLYQHDMDARPHFKRFQIPLTESSIFKPHENDVKKAETAATQFIGNIKNKLPASTLTKFSIFSPKVYTGIIASGDQFISNPTKHDALKLDSEKVLATEMEGAAVAQVCHEHKTPYVILRTISDKADHRANVDFKSFIAEVASHYSEGIVSNFMKL